jgi:hypothetical protein
VRRLTAIELGLGDVREIGAQPRRDRRASLGGDAEGFEFALGHSRECDTDR